MVILTQVQLERVIAGVERATVAPQGPVETDATIGTLGATLAK